MADLQDSSEAYRIAEEYGTEEEIKAKYKKLEKERTQWAGFLSQLESLLENCKNFNKTLCF